MVADALCAALRSAALLVVDDLHVADDELRHIVRALPPHVWVVATMLAGDAGEAPALEAVDPTRCSTLALPPLDNADARALLRALEPGLDPADETRIVAHAQGLPLMLVELLRTGGDDLRLLLRAQVDRLEPRERSALLRAALLERPAPARLVGAGARALLAQGLLVERPAGLAVRNALVAEAVRAATSGEERRGTHLALARALRVPLEAARHLDAAGDQEAAGELALKAARSARSPGDRARGLALAASCLPARSALRLEAAEAMSAAGEHPRSVDLLDGLPPAPAVHRLRSHALFELDRREEATRELELALASAAEEERVLALIELARQRGWSWDGPGAVAPAHEAWREARRLGQHEQAAVHALGTALYVAHDSACLGHLQRALDLAIEPAAEANAALLLVVALAVYQQGRGSEALARRAYRCARRAGLGRLATTARFHWAAARLDHRGDVIGALTMLDELELGTAAQGAQGSQVRAALALALAEAGQHRRAAGLATGIALEAEDVWSRELELTVRARAAWCAGRLQATVELAGDALALDSPSGLAADAAALRGWALVELGRELPPTDLAPLNPRVRAVREELDALRLIAAGEHTPAAVAFERAARLAHGMDELQSRRCRYGAGLAMVEAGDRTRAGRLLARLERDAVRGGQGALLPRIERALRRAGARRSAPRATAGTLTARQRELLELVAEGRTTHEIASVAGLSEATVTTHLRAAMRRLGARSRPQAVALLRSRPRSADEVVVVRDRRALGALRSPGESPVLAVDDDASEARAMELAARPGPLALLVEDAERASRLFADLRRLRPVRIVEQPPAALRGDEAALVAALATGALLGEAAASCGLSERTAKRRLAALRQRLGVSTTAEALARLQTLR
jgi:DNA-binding NarL/FixJ family response regulator